MAPAQIARTKIAQSRIAHIDFKQCKDGSDADSENKDSTIKDSTRLIGRASQDLSLLWCTGLKIDFETRLKI